MTRHGELAAELRVGDRGRVEDVIAAGLDAVVTQFTRSANAAASSGTAKPQWPWSRMARARRGRRALRRQRAGRRSAPSRTARRGRRSCAGSARGSAAARRSAGYSRVPFGWRPCGSCVDPQHGRVQRDLVGRERRVGVDLVDRLNVVLHVARGHPHVAAGHADREEEVTPQEKRSLKAGRTPPEMFWMTARRASPPAD